MTSIQAYTMSGYLQWAGSLIIVISCFYRYKTRASYIKILALYAIVGVCISLAQKISEIFFERVGINSLGNGFVLSEALFFALLYYFAAKDSGFKRGVIVLAALYTLFYIITFVFFIDRSFSFIRFGRDFLLILYAIAYFYYLIRKLPEENLLKFPMFWINSAVIFFFSGTFILSFLIDYIANVLRESTANFWTFRNFFRFAFCCVLVYASWLDWRLLKLKKTGMS